MYSWEIDRLLKIRNYLISTSEYFEIISTSPQITNVKYDPFEKNFKIKTEDKYEFKVKIKQKS